MRTDETHGAPVKGWRPGKRAARTGSSRRRARARLGGPSGEDERWLGVAAEMEKGGWSWSRWRVADRRGGGIGSGHFAALDVPFAYRSTAVEANANASPGTTKHPPITITRSLFASRPVPLDERRTRHFSHLFAGGQSPLTHPKASTSFCRDTILPRLTALLFAFLKISGHSLCCIIAISLLPHSRRAGPSCIYHAIMLLSWGSLCKHRCKCRCYVIYAVKTHAGP